MLVSGEEVGTKGFGRAVQWLAELFYTDIFILAYPQPALLKAALDVLTVLFDRVDL